MLYLTYIIATLSTTHTLLLSEFHIGPIEKKTDLHDLIDHTRILLNNRVC